MITSEGFANRLIDPWVREFGLDGRQLGSLPVPAPFLPNADGTRGVRQNLGFESAGDAAERPLLLHRRPRTRSSRTARRRRSPPAAPRGCSATTSSGASSTASTSTGPIRSPSRPCRRTSSRSTASSRCCRSTTSSLLSMERSFSVGAPGHRQHDQALRRRAPRRGRRQRLRQPGDAARRHPAGREDAAARPRRARDPARQRRGDDVRARPAATAAAR